MSARRQANGRAPRRRTRNRRLDPERWRKRLRIGVTACGLLAALFVLLRFDAELPDTSSMGLRVDLRHLDRWGLPSAEGLRFDWRDVFRVDWLSLDRVYFLGLEQLDAAELTAELGLTGSVPLVDVDPDTLCARLRERGHADACSAVRVPPGWLIATIRERHAVALRDADGRGLGADGRPAPVRSADAESLPRLTGDVARALPFLEAAEWLGVPLHRIEARPRGTDRIEVALWPRRGAKRVLPGPDPVSSLLRYRALVEMGVVDKDDLELDLRFRGRAFLREAPRGGDEGGQA